MRIEQDIKLDFSDVLLKPKRSEIRSRKEINLNRTFHFKYSAFETKCIPIISSNMASVTNPEVAKIMDKHGMLSCAPKHQGRQFSELNGIIRSIGLEDEFIGSNSIFLCLDVPNGYIEAVIDRTKTLRKQFPSLIIIVGNVVTAEQTEALILAGADIVKVGIGSGAACSTRIKTGVGMPQLSAIIECADAAHGLGGHIISDGGCVVSGDIVKAFAAGADFVMLGGMLAGHDENAATCVSCEGTGRIYSLDKTDSVKCTYCQGGKNYDFYGSSSERGNNETAGGLKTYRAAEGWEMKLPSRGPLENTLLDIEGGLRSACSYVGAKNLKNLPKCATFVQCNRQANSSLLDYRV